MCVGDLSTSMVDHAMQLRISLVVQVSLYRHDNTKQEFAVKMIKTFDPHSYAIEKKILALGRSTWNHFLAALYGEFFYEVCEN